MKKIKDKTAELYTDYAKLIREFAHYIKRNRYVMILLGLSVCLVHGDKLFSTNNGIDTEKIIFEGREIYDSWMGIGRQGLVFLKWMLGQQNYNPYFAGLLTLLFLTATVVVFTFLFEAVRGERGGETEKTGQRYLNFAFGILLITHPVLTEQLYFSLQGAEVTLAFILCGTSLLLSHRRRFFMGTLLLIPALGVYQAMAPLYLFGIAATVCLHSMCIGKGKARLKEEIFYAFRLGAVFLAAFIINQTITALFFSKSAYLSNQVQWKRDRIGEGIRRIFAHVRDVLAGSGIFYTCVFFWLALGLFALVLWRNRGNSADKSDSGYSFPIRIWNLLLLSALLASPFYLTFVLGERPVIRGQLALPFTIAFMAYLAGLLLRESKKGVVRAVGKTILLFLCFSAVWRQTDITCRLYYSDAVRYQEDLWLAGNLEQDIIKFTGKCDYTGTVVFVGKRNAPGNCASLTGDVMGQSLFAWDTEVDPVNYWSSSRIIGFMHCMGTNYKAPTAAQTAQAAARAKGMPCYPAAGSMVWYEDMVVVKLSGE